MMMADGVPIAQPIRLQRFHLEWLVQYILISGGFLGSG